MDTGLKTLVSFHRGIPVIEFGAFVPWLIRESDLYDIIPKRAFTFSVAHWPMLQFTLLGINAAFGFNFVSDQARRFTELAIFDDNPSTMRESFLSSSEALRKKLGPPNSVDEIEYGQLRWDDGSVVVDNAMETGRMCGAMDDSTWHSLIIRLFQAAPPQLLVKPH